MNYSQSQQILRKIKSSKNILINVHKSPDLDTVGAATAMYEVLVDQFGKKVAIVCPDKIGSNFMFLKNADKINQQVDFSKFKWSEYDLFLILDTGSVDRVTGKKEISLPNIPRIVVDHHKTNKIKGDIQLLDEDASATCEVLYRVFEDWKVNITSNIATSLFSGIAGDTVFFKYGEDNKKIFNICSKLISFGADKKKIVTNMFDSLDFNFAKLVGIFISEMKIEKNRFVWAALPYLVYESHGKPRGAREEAADTFFRSIKDIEFGVAMLEQRPGELSVSFRSKEKDISVIAEKLGGGGHKNAAGATLHGKFEDCVKKVIIVSEAN